MSAKEVPAKKRVTRTKHPRITTPLSHVKIPKALPGKFVHYFVPHKRNGYKPLFLRAGAVSATAALIIVLFIGATAADHVLVTSDSPQVAAVVASTLVDLANSDRTQNGEPALAVSPQLQAAAQLKANDMAAKSYFAHVSPDGKDPWYWFAQAGYNFTFAGENLAVYFSDSTAVNTAWMNSPEHRANILSDNFTQIGIATAEGMYQGQETVFVVQEFGTPADVATAPSSSLSNIAAAAPAAALPIIATTTASSTESAARVESPAVKGASIEAVAPTPVKVIEETPTFIAVKYIGAPAPSMPQNIAGTTPEIPTESRAAAAIFSFVTSPQTDLSLAYGVIAAIVALALILEIVVEFRRSHPHRIAMGFSLICLMVILIYAGHSLILGQLIIV